MNAMFFFYFCEILFLFFLSTMWYYFWLKWLIQCRIIKKNGKIKEKNTQQLKKLLLAFKKYPAGKGEWPVVWFCSCGQNGTAWICYLCDISPIKWDFLIPQSIPHLWRKPVFALVMRKHIFNFIPSKLYDFHKPTSIISKPKISC